jgi:hypothetical protein
MMWNFGYHLARARGGMAREAYRILLPIIVRRPVDPPRTLDLDVFAYSNEAMLPEQIASVRSFLKYAGRPNHFTIVSDGTHGRRAISLLQQVDSCIRLADARDFLPEQSLSRDYFGNHPTGKQLGLIMSLPRERPALYIDADVLFFPGAVALADLLRNHDAPALYLRDCQVAGDERLLHDRAEAADPVNTGVLFFFQKLDWSSAIERLQQLDGAPNFFTNQTMTHLTMHAHGASPLDPAKFVLQLDDQFQFDDRYADDCIILRHYVNPVRHKFWEQIFS